MDEGHERLIVDHFCGRVTTEELALGLGVPPDALGDFALRLLHASLPARDAIAVELGLSLGFRYGLSPAFVAPLLALLDEPWHHRHEHVVSALDRLCAPDAASALARAARAHHDYLAYDESYALGVKCIWALGRLATADSVAALAQLRHCGNPVLEANAGAELARIAAEAPSKSLRAAALLARSSSRDR